MPIEIKELNIKAYIDDSTAPNQAASSTDTGNNNNTGNIENIIAACVEQVLQILKDKEER